MAHWNIMEKIIHSAEQNAGVANIKTNANSIGILLKMKGSVDLYVKNEQHDGYIRDGCVWSNEIDIYDKMSAQIIYANGVTVNYSLTTYSPYEGWQIAFNGMNGRMETWEDIPYLQKTAG